jgi:hypothetical protein
MHKSNSLITQHRRLRIRCAELDTTIQDFVAQGLRIINARKIKYYGAALSNFERAKHCFERAGLEGEWSRTVRQVRADHYRKRSFMPGFERLVEGGWPSDAPSFLERAKARWRVKERSAR